MTGHTISLFVHLLGLITLFAALVIHQFAGARIRRAPTAERVRVWLGLVGSVKSLFPVGSILLLLSGLHMAGSGGMMTAPWVLVGLVTLLALMVVGPIMQRRGYGAVGVAVQSQDGPVTPEMARTIAARGPWAAMSALTGAALGLVWLMTIKPGWTGSLVALLLPAVVGAVLGRIAARRAGPPADAGTRPAEEAEDAVPAGGTGV